LAHVYYDWENWPFDTRMNRCSS